MNRYRCFFHGPAEFPNPPRYQLQLCNVLDDPETPGLERMSAFVGGFWLNELGELVTAADDEKHIWIPPSAIKYIRLEPDKPRSDQWTEEERTIMEAQGKTPIEYNKIDRHEETI